MSFEAEKDTGLEESQGESIGDPRKKSQFSSLSEETRLGEFLLIA